MNNHPKRIPRVRLARDGKNKIVEALRIGLSVGGSRFFQSTFNWAGKSQWIAPRRIHVRRDVISVPRLEKPFDGLRIAHLSDFHCGAFMTQSALERMFERAAIEDPDLIALTGDFVNGHPEEIGQFIRSLPKLPRPPLGVFAVLGNHDYVNNGADAIAAALAGEGIR